MVIREFDKNRKVFLADLAVNRAVRRVLHPGEYEWFEIPDCAIYAGLVYQDGINLLQPDTPEPVAKKEDIEKLLKLNTSVPQTDKDIQLTEEKTKKPIIKKEDN